MIRRSFIRKTFVTGTIGCIRLNSHVLPGVCQDLNNQFRAEQYTRKIIYRSPQSPGYTCWVGAWVMPDKSFMVTFKQATGPVEGRDRFMANDERPMWLVSNDPRRDFTGLHLANIYLRSIDGGDTWHKVAEESFSGPFDRPVWGGSHIALLDGSILRAVDGSLLPLKSNTPRRIYFQRSHDLGKTWGEPEIPPEPRRSESRIGDYGDCITRVRRLRSGYLIATGVLRTYTDPRNRRIGEPLLMVSPDEGVSWYPQTIIVPAEHHQKPNVWNEWDSVELPNGDLFCVFRRGEPANPSRQVRWQGILRKKQESWVLEKYVPAVLEHSGHPELLATLEGIVLHIATTGVQWTKDAGENWHFLEFDHVARNYRSYYYPMSLQSQEGRIYVFSHNGWDNAYGEFDQSIVMDSFRIATK